MGDITSRNLFTSQTGSLVGTDEDSQTATAMGGILAQDVYAFEKLSRFNFERIPERVVHARGATALGQFESFGVLSNLTIAKFLTEKGRKTDIVVRMSTVLHSKGSPEGLRDPRGFAIKFKTEDEGNFDLVGNNLPVFFIRDHIKFPDLVHSMKPSPITNIQDPNRFFDFFSANGGMSTHMLTFLYSDLGIPRGYRFMDGNSVHAYKLVNEDGKVTYVKFRWFTQQGVKNLTASKATEMQGKDFNFATRDLYDAIRRKEFPEWEMAFQQMEPSQLDDFDFDPLDATKEWPIDQFPFTPIGKFVLNKIPENFFQQSEQVAFCPANYMPGAIEPSEDRLLQGRLVSYLDTQRHRLGTPNYQDLPINRAKSPLRNYAQDGVASVNHFWTGEVNYSPNNAEDGFITDSRYLLSVKEICGATQQKAIKKTLNFQQAGELFNRFSEGDRKNLISNLAGDLGQVKSMQIRNTMCSHFYKADETYGTMISEAVACDLPTVKKLAAALE